MPITNKYPVINYTSRDFNSIKNDLVEYAKRYYPDTFKDFNEASFGALMLDTVAYIGDVLSFYVDFQANESFLTNAIQYENVIKLARQMGYKHDTSVASSGLVTFFIICPANANGIGPDTKYLPALLRGTQVRSTGGPTFILVDDVSFSDPENEVIVATTDTNNTPTNYAIKAVGRVSSGTITQEEVTVGVFERFKNIELDTKHITEIVSVFDSQGHEYFEVENLSQNVIYSSVRNTRADKHRVQSIMVPVIVPRRFAVEKIAATTSLQFGFGSDSELKTNSIADPTDVVMNLLGRDYVTDRGFDPKKLTSTDKFGVGPSDTTLTIVSRTNNYATVNAASNTITEIVSPLFAFTDRELLTASTVNTVMASLEAANEEPITGDVTLPTVEELKHRVKAHFAAQNRAVTTEDYRALVYSMPGRFGKIKRCSVSQDPDSFKRNLNLYVISQAPNLSLIAATDTAKENLKNWINRYKMVNDTIDILDARIANIGIEFKVVAMSSTEGSKHSVLRRCVAELVEKYFYRNYEIGEPLDISRIYQILNGTSGVMDTVDVKIVSKSGGLYSGIPINIESNTSADGRKLYIPEDHILELKYKDKDISGVVE